MDEEMSLCCVKKDSFGSFVWDKTPKIVFSQPSLFRPLNLTVLRAEEKNIIWK